ncbi:MAG: anti-sigma factor [Burkholderiales bacterium]|jgi:anti-sigma factor RsiW|nr:anti-sigma factor [Burkholderiales bacterium]
MSEIPVTESELQAHVDGRLPAGRAAEVEAWLAQHPEDAQRITAYRRQDAALRAAFDPLLAEALPPRLHPGVRKRTGLLRRYAAVAALMAISGFAGWQLHALVAAERAQSQHLARVAAVAHAVYSPEVRHPVEVGADQEAHLVRWLSKRLGVGLKVPHLAGLGYSLVGGRLLPGERGPAAQFMYQDVKGQRLTLYVRTTVEARAPTAFRYAQENGVSVFYWLDGRLGYALSGETGREELLRVADAVYRQINP